MRKSLGQAPENNEKEGHGDQDTSRRYQQLHPPLLNEQPAIHAVSAQAQQQDPKDPSNNRMTRWTAVVGIAAVIQLFITCFQWQVMKNTLKIDQRAWLTIRQPKTNETGLSVGQKPHVSMRIQNSGKSPAMDVRSRITWVIVDKLPDGPTPPREKVDGKESLSLIAPGEYQQSVGELPEPLTQETFDRMKRGELSLFAYGTITYSDIFHVEHRTTLCFYLHDMNYFSLTACGKWNYAD